MPFIPPCRITCGPRTPPPPRGCAPTKEWDSLHYKYQCLPYERVVVEGAPVTVYSVVAPAAKADPETDCEWMYQAQGAARRSLPASLP